MFRGIVNSQPIPKPSACLLPEAIHQRFSAVDIEVVHDEMNGLGIGIIVDDVLHDMSELRGGPVGRGRREVPASLRFYNPKYICGTTPFVLIIRSRRLSGSHRPRRTHVRMQRYRLFVQAYYRFVHPIRFLIDRQYVLHLFEVVLVQFRHAPHFFPATASGRGFQGVSGWFPDQHGEPICA